MIEQHHRILMIAHIHSQHIFCVAPDSRIALGVSDDLSHNRAAADTLVACEQSSDGKLHVAVGHQDHQITHHPRTPLANNVEISTSRRSEEHTSELQSPTNIVCRLLL